MLFRRSVEDLGILTLVLRMMRNYSPKLLGLFNIGFHLSAQRLKLDNGTSSLIIYFYVLEGPKHDHEEIVDKLIWRYPSLVQLCVLLLW